ncbi:hypothetical protein Bca4012_025874 [Brassica carinata]|uniref:Uncharacterized protein n=1 Tax=Brassica carinata TaxID=52824 RepID=A0A8X7VH75_BRACI|nr:hypothetical protein Bca52824_022911 [Brassica carinata]
MIYEAHYSTIAGVKTELKTTAPQQLGSVLGQNKPFGQESSKLSIEMRQVQNREQWSSLQMIDDKTSKSRGAVQKEVARKATKTYTKSTTSIHNRFSPLETTASC